MVWFHNKTRSPVTNVTLSIIEPSIKLLITTFAVDATCTPYFHEIPEITLSTYALFAAYEANVGFAIFDKFTELLPPKSLNVTILPLSACILIPSVLFGATN